MYFPLSARLTVDTCSPTASATSCMVIGASGPSPPEIGRLETQNFLAAAQERLFTLRDAVDEPFGLGELFGQILPDLRIFALVPKGLIKGTHSQLRRVGPVDSDGKSTVPLCERTSGTMELAAAAAENSAQG